MNDLSHSPKVSPHSKAPDDCVQAWLHPRMQDVQPRAFQKVMGLQNETLAECLLKNESIREVLSRDLCRQLDRKSDPIPKMSSKEASVCERLSWISAEQMAQLERSLTVLLNRKTALFQTSSAVVAEVLDWAEIPGLLTLLRKPPLPAFGAIEPVSQFDLKALKFYATQLAPYLIGLLPKRLVIQRSLRLAEEPPHAREPLPQSDTSRAVLIDGLTEIFSLTDLQEAKNATI